MTGGAPEDAVEAPQSRWQRIQARLQRPESRRRAVARRAIGAIVALFGLYMVFLGLKGNTGLVAYGVVWAILGLLIVWRDRVVALVAELAGRRR
jgi:Flp pilus assembly protein TadB